MFMFARMPSVKCYACVHYLVIEETNVHHFVMVKTIDWTLSASSEQHLAEREKHSTKPEGSSVSSEPGYPPLRRGTVYGHSKRQNNTPHILTIYFLYFCMLTRSRCPAASFLFYFFSRSQTKIGSHGCTWHVDMLLETMSGDQQNISQITLCIPAPSVDEYVTLTIHSILMYIRM